MYEIKPNVKWRVMCNGVCKRLCHVDVSAEVASVPGMNCSELSLSPRVITIASDADIVAARSAARTLAGSLGFKSGDLVMIASAVYEVARNIIDYARSGEMILSVVKNSNDRWGIEVVSRDRGPGIPNVSLAMEYGFSTSHGLGLGLPGSSRFMDEFYVESGLSQGTTVTMRKWLP